MSKKYSAIIGLNPSKGARSPKLWNTAYAKLDQSTRMKCIDIEKEKEVPDLIKKLEEDINFLGGCIAFPYKEIIFKCLGYQNIDKVSQSIGAINCLYRSEENFLKGSNTDGYAALSSFKNLINRANYMPKSILIGGLGGAGKAVASYFSSYFVPKGVNLVCASRTNNNEFCKSINSEWTSWDNIDNKINSFEAFVNCTSVGTGKQIEQTPVKMDSHLKNLKFVYDIIYDPLQTTLISKAKENKIYSANGLEMNLLQAVKAFNLTNKLLNIEEKKIMRLMSC